MRPCLFAIPSSQPHKLISYDTAPVCVCVCVVLVRVLELGRAAGADVILVPSAFMPTTGLAHWEVCLCSASVQPL